jgi:hypothetical protein
MQKGSTCAIRPGARIADDTTRSNRNARPVEAMPATYGSHANRYGEKLFVGFDDDTTLRPAARGAKSASDSGLCLADWLIGLACHFPWLN